MDKINTSRSQVKYPLMYVPVVLTGHSSSYTRAQICRLEEVTAINEYFMASLTVMMSDDGFK